MSAKISLCMIVKNEQKNLERCLASIQGAVDEIIVVDTGSTDETCEVAARFGASVHPFFWKDDFSEARNASLALATGDWILFLDADEALAPGSAEVLKRITELNNDGYFIKIINYIGSEGWVDSCPDLVFRLFRNHPEYRFRGAIHEQIVDVILEKNSQARYQMAEDLVIFHYGYLTQQIIEKDKKNRNINIIERELESAPHNRLLRYHYGVELFRADRLTEAAEELSKAANGIDPGTIYLPKLLRYIVLAYHGTQQYEKAMETTKLGLSLFPNYADLYYYGGLIQAELRNYAQAYELFQQALSMPAQPAYYAPFSGTIGFRTFYQLGQLAEKFCNEEEALRYYLLSLRDNPNFTAALRSIIRILNPRKDPEYTRQALAKICDFCTPEAKLLMANLFFSESAYSLALEYFEQADFPGSYTRILKAICLIQQRRSLEALHILEDIPADDAQFALAKLNKLLCFWFEKNRAKVRSIAEEFFALGLSFDTGAVIGLLRDSLKKKNSAPPVVLQEEGMALIRDIVLRALDLGEYALAQSLLSQIETGTLRKYALDWGELFLQYDYVDQAEYYVQMYLEMNPEDARAYGKLAEIKKQKGCKMEAIGLYRQALTHDPQEPSYYVKLIRFYEDMRCEILEEACRRHPDLPVFKTLLEEARKEP